MSCLGTRRAGRHGAGERGEEKGGGIWTVGSGGRDVPPTAVVARAPLMITLQGNALIFSTDSTP